MAKNINFRKKSSYEANTPEAKEHSQEGLKKWEEKEKTPIADVFTIQKYKKDIINFAEEQFYIPESRRPIVLQEFQKDKIFRPLFYGDRLYTMALIGEPKKSGKSCIASLIASWYLFTQGIRAGQDVEVLICAADKDMASWIIFDKLVKSIKMNNKMFRQAKITADSITIPSKNSVVRVLATDVSAAGQNPDLVIFDELYLYRYEGMKDFFEVLTTTPTKPHPLILIVSTAGFDTDEDDLLFGLYNKGLNLPKKPDPSFYFWWDDGEEANRMPWQTKKYLDQQRGRLREGTFQRFHYNYFTSGMEVFITSEDLDACIDNKLRPPLPSKSISIITGVDIGLRHDTTALVSLTRKDNKIQLIDCKTFQGRIGKEVQLEEQVEAYILKLKQNFDLKEVLFDPYQFTRSAQTLTNKGIKMTEFPQTLDRLTQMSQNLYDLIRGGNIVFFKHKELRKHLLSAKAKESSRGWRLIKRKASSKIDISIALAMSAQGIVNSGILSGGCRVRWLDELEKLTQAERQRQFIESDDDYESYALPETYHQL
jgi:phage terminase large subunit-like protein